MVKTTEKKVAKKVCLKCHREQALSNFYNTADIELFSDSKMPICKTCVFKHIDEKGFDGFQSIMRLINKPIYQDLFKGDYKDYIRQVNSLGQWKDVDYNDSDMFKDVKNLEVTKRAKPTELTPDELKDSEDFWTIGYSEAEYIWLNTEYEDYLNRYDVDSKTLENLIREICLVQLDIRNARSAKRDVKNELKAYNDLLTAANLKPVQETGAQAVDQETFGTFIKKLENERPVSTPDPMWADVDNVGKYIRTFFLGNMAKLFGKENKFQTEYEDEMQKYTVKPPREDD